MKIISLTQGQTAIVDDKNFEWLSLWKWHARRVRRGDRLVYYAARVTHRPSRKTIWMHREIAKTPKGRETDHKDGNGLHNWEANLRPATVAQNRQNRARFSSNTSGFKGVCFNQKRQRWQAAIQFLKRRIHLGLFDTAEEAARAYDRKAFELFGEFAWLNFSNVKLSFI